MLLVPDSPWKPSTNFCHRGELPSSTRKSYINAVKCMQEKPGLLPTQYYSAARSRLDDFTMYGILIPRDRLNRS